MMIRPFSYTCARDWKSFCLVVDSWHRFREEPWTVYYDPDQPYTEEMKAFVEKRNIRFRRQSRKNFGQWCWDSSMCKLDGWRDMAKDETDDNLLLLYCDSDSIWHNGEIDRFVMGDFCGLPNTVKIEVDGKPWAHYSGCLQIATVRAAKKIGALSADELAAIRRKMQSQGDQSSGGICQNEDVVISFLMLECGIQGAPLAPAACETDPEAVILGKRIPYSPYSHISGIWDRQFCGIYVKNKWDIPDALRSGGLYPC